MEQIKYEIGALTNQALELLEEKGLGKYQFTNYQQAFKIVDKLNDYFKCNCFRVVSILRERSR